MSILSIFKPFQRIFFEKKFTKFTSAAFYFSIWIQLYKVKSHFIYTKEKETFGLKNIQTLSLFCCLYSHYNYTQHKSIAKQKILRPF